MKEKIYLSETEKNFSNKELSKKYGVSIPTIIAAKKRGWFWKNHRESHFKNIELPPIQKTKLKNLIYLTEDERRMSISVVARKFNVSKAVALKARKRGWIANKLGRSVNRTTDNNFPQNVSIKEVIEDAKIAAVWVIKRLNLKWQELDDIKQVGLVRLLEVTAESGFVNSHWRKKVAYWIGMRYATTQISRFNNVFCRSDEREDALFFKDISFEEREILIDCEKFIRAFDKLKRKKKELIIKWMNCGNNRPSKKVINILNEIKNRHLT